MNRAALTIALLLLIVAFLLVLYFYHPDQASSQVSSVGFGGGSFGHHGIGR